MLFFLMKADLGFLYKLKANIITFLKNILIIASDNDPEY